MSTSTGEKLYNLLPAVYRLRDADQGYPLRALLGVIGREVANIEDDLARLYDNWFIETCDEWVVPYIGDLLGVRGVLALQNAGFSQRGLVANAIDYRRRKGTAAILEQLARDLTGWDAKAVEFFQRLDTMQFINHVRPQSLGTVNLREAASLELVATPFEIATHTADVRHIDNGRGKYNIPNLGLFLWRLQSYAIMRGTARPVANPPDGRYWFNPLGLDVPLFNAPQTVTESTQLVGEANVPQALRRRPLFDELQARRKAMVDGATPRPTYFGVNPVLEVWVRKNPGDAFVALLPEEIAICDLEDWRRPTADTFKRADGTQFSIAVAVDPVLGRLAFPTGVVASAVQVSYAYGFSGDLGGGPYARRTSLAAALTRPITWQIGVMQDATGPGLVKTLVDAVKAWNQQPPGTVGLIAVMDNGTYKDNLTGADAIQVPAGSQLAIVAADWPLEPVPGFIVPQRVVGRFTPDERRAHLQGNIAVQGNAPAASPNPGELVINGLLIEGALTIQAGNLASLRLQDSTLVPTLGGLTVITGTGADQKNDRLSVSLERAIAGVIVLAEGVRGLNLTDSIVGGGGGTAISASGADGGVESSTIFGQSSFRSLEASNSIFTQTCTVTRRQVGCVRFSYLPINSLAPRRYRCQPADPASAARVTPQFTSFTYGAPGYAQLATDGAEEIMTGADDEGELGAFHFLQQVQRVKNLQANLDEYLRFGLEAGIFFAT